MHGSASGRSFSELPGIFRRLWMQNAAHVSILMCSDPPPLARSNNTNSDHRGSSYLTNALRSHVPRMVSGI